MRSSSFCSVLALAIGLASLLSAQEARDTTGITIICKDGQGRAVANAEVYLFQRRKLPDGRGDYREFGPYRSDAKGRVRCEVAVTYDGGRYDRLVYARCSRQLVGGGRSMGSEGGSARGSSVDVLLVPSRTLPGRVTVPEGHDPDRVRVRILSMYALDGRQVHNGRDFGTLLGRSSAFPGLGRILPKVFECDVAADGSFELRDVPVAARLYLACEGPGLAQAQWANIKRGPVPLPKRIEIAMASESVLSGQLKGPKDATLSGVSVWVRATSLNGGKTRLYSRSRFRTKTDADGRFRIGGLPEAEFDVHVEPVQRTWIVRPRSLQLGVAQHRRGIVMELGRAVDVIGIVVESGNGSPIEGALVIALTDGDPALRMGTCTTDSRGRFTLRLPAGRAKLYFGSVPKGFVYPDPQFVAEIEVTTQQQSRAPLRLVLRRDG